jgi:hypothetical protein
MQLLLDTVMADVADSLVSVQKRSVVQEDTEQTAQR